LVRSDVVTAEVPDSSDLGALLLATKPGTDERLRGWDATGRLLLRLRSRGVRHHDLNVKNVLLRETADRGFETYLLDVDRVELGCNRRYAERANRNRLVRSVEKWRDTRGAAITDEEIEALRRTATSIP
jgi:hypothetical protein